MVKSLKHICMLYMAYDGKHSSHLHDLYWLLKYFSLVFRDVSSYFAYHTYGDCSDTVLTLMKDWDEVENEDETCFGGALAFVCPDSHLFSFWSARVLFWDLFGVFCLFSVLRNINGSVTLDWKTSQDDWNEFSFTFGIWSNQLVWDHFCSLVTW